MTTHLDTTDHAARTGTDLSLFVHLDGAGSGEWESTEGNEQSWFPQPLERPPCRSHSGR
jgi:hypothetical protein